MLFTAGLIIVLHTLVAHLHNEQGFPTTSSKSSKQENVIDWIIKLIKTDMGEGHLDHFSLKTDCQSIDQSYVQMDDLPSFLPSLSPILVEDMLVRTYASFVISTSSSFVQSQSQVPDAAILCTFGLRAPPVFTSPYIV